MYLISLGTSSTYSQSHQTYRSRTERQRPNEIQKVCTCHEHISEVSWFLLSKSDVLYVPVQNAIQTFRGNAIQKVN